ncbi:hypothetical protein BpHYR1_005690 [Brachionus plicatilis]|uniref:Uncharacterized protein n=1 Tax=Brachionus plicatilis TaxID=10195 RepID=A0A3M7P0W9_BRAPC|nr:hypothetical protein BpHYR1_005690 [Brachionus plicatilis]
MNRVSNWFKGLLKILDNCVTKLWYRLVDLLCLLRFTLGFKSKPKSALKKKIHLFIKNKIKMIHEY